MKPAHLLAALLACVIANDPVHADPIHAIAGGAYWHHDSGWEFAQKIGEFELVGIPQDVAGSRDAVAYYEREFKGARVVASVDVYPADSASAAADKLATTAGGMASESPFVVGKARQLTGVRQIFTVGEKHSLIVLYLVSAGEWHVRIRVQGANEQILPALESFALDQRWETLNAVPTAR